MPFRKKVDLELLILFQRYVSNSIQTTAFLTYLVMDRIVQWALSIPPVTRYWSIAILISSIITTFRLVLSITLVFLVEKAFGSQPWRLITSFCYFGELLIELILNIWFIIRSSRYLEEGYSTRLSLFPSTSINRLSPDQRTLLQTITDRNKSIDYLYFVLLICGSIIAGVTYGQYKFDFRIPTLGFLLDDILLYIWCRSNPNLEVNMFGFLTIRAAYLPWCYTLLNWVLLNYFLNSFLAIISGDMNQITSVFSQPFVWRIVICYTLGHFWWFTREFLLTQFYCDQNDERRKLRSETPRRIEQQAKISPYQNISRQVLTFILLPPWYWVILRKLQQRG